MHQQRIHHTLQKLLDRRGYTVPGTLPLTHFTVFRERDNDTLLVFWPEETGARVGVGVLRDMVKMMDDVCATNAVLISSGMTSSATAFVHTLMESNKFITAIPPSSLMFDIFEHADVPPHRLLTPEEVKQLLKDRNLKLKQFPSIKMDDPMCRYLGGRPGDVFEITRNRPTVGHHLYYRKVVDGALE
jgi:DNA-directed RNA polymerase subunit H (RpoH/RPB5)